MPDKKVPKRLSAIKAHFERKMNRLGEAHHLVADQIIFVACPSLHKRVRIKN